MSKKQKLQDLIKQAEEQDRLAQFHHDKSMKYMSSSLDLGSQAMDLDIEINKDQWIEQPDGSLVKIQS